MTARILIGDVLSNSGRFKPGVHSWRKPQPHWEKSWLIREYVERELSSAEIATSIGCTDANVLFWLRKHGIPRRSVSAARSLKHWGAAGSANPMFGKTGAKNPRYVDGSSPERQRLYVQASGRAFLRQIYKRDGYRCVRCSAPNTGPRTLHAHHIKPWAGNPTLRFDQSNVVTLCRPCHNWVHSRLNSALEYRA